MKIAQVCPRYYPDIGGVETHVREISERLVKRGFEVEVICTDPGSRLSKREIINGVKVTRFASFAPGEAYYFAPLIYFYLKNHNYDLIHAHSYHALPALFAALAKSERRLIFTPHYHRGGHTRIRDILHKPYRLIGSKIFEKAEKVICVSEYERRKIISDFNIPAGKIEKIPNGLDLKDFENLKPCKKNSDGKTLLYVGRLEKYKGIQHIIHALRYLEDFKLDIIGKGPYESNLRGLAEGLSVANRINWYKNITWEEMLAHYASADIFLMLSTHEAYGITVAEALAAGVQCIVATNSALDEFVDGERCTGIGPPITADKLVKAIQRQKNTERKIGGRNLPLNDWDYVADKLINIYKEVQSICASTQ